MTECEDVAEWPGGSMEEAEYFVRTRMPDENIIVICNVAWALFKKKGWNP